MSRSLNTPIKSAPINQTRKLSILGHDIEYTLTPWGEVIGGSKEGLQRLGLGVGQAFPGQAGGPKRILNVLDPRGLSASIYQSWANDGTYHASISIPGREQPEVIKREYAPGVEVEESYFQDFYVGSTDALVAAGLVPVGHFPGMPAMRKVRVTIFADGSLPLGAATIHHRRTDEPGTKIITRKTKNTYRVSVRLESEVEEERRVARQQATVEYEERMSRLARPRTLDECILMGYPSVLPFMRENMARNASRKIKPNILAGNSDAPLPAPKLVHTQHKTQREQRTLTMDEQKLVAAFRGMCVESRGTILRVAEKLAVDLRTAMRPSLYLIEGGRE